MNIEIAEGTGKFPRIVLIVGLILLTGWTACGKQSGFFYTEIFSGEKFLLHLGSSVRQLKQGWPVKTVLSSKKLRRIMAVASNPTGTRFWAATKFNFYTYNKQQQRWKIISRKGLHNYASISALCRSKQGLYAGTTSYGVYHFKNNRWHKLAAGLPGEQPARKRTFYETVTSLSVAPDGTVYAGLHFSGGVYRLNRGQRIWRKVKTSPVVRVSALHAVNDGVYVFDGSRWIAAGNLRTKKVPAFLSKASARYKLRPQVMTAGNGSSAVAFTADYKPPLSRYAAQMKKRRGVYLSSHNASPAKLKKLVKMMRRKQLDTLVVDIKNDDGIVCYAGSDPLIKKVGSYRNIIDMKKLVTFARKNNLWLIGRLVVFKDPLLHRYQSGKYALKDRYTGGIWNSTTRERWVDPFNPFVQKYNRTVGKEVLQLGFNEIQFDYIRFPTDGPIYRIKYPARPKNSWKIDALENFLAGARRDLPGPVSVDIYGFNGWFSMGRWMGQDITLFARYVDAISPMHYPSHFQYDFRMEKGRLQRSYRILFHGTLRPRLLTGGTVEIRPWVQAFRWRAFRYGAGYINRQLKGVRDGGMTGWLLWNANNRYPLLPRLKVK